MLASTRQARQAAQLFAPDAYQATYQATNGVPRLINQVCDHSLLLAFRAGRRQIERNTVEEAWADLQQLPTPWNGKTEKKSSSGTIEFGSLDDECSDSAADSIASIPSTLPAPAALGSEAEPADRVAEIQGMLAGLEKELQPIAVVCPSQPVAEGKPALVRSCNPFDEPFQEEELVVEPFHANDRATTDRSEGTRWTRSAGGRLAGTRIGRRVRGRGFTLGQCGGLRGGCRDAVPRWLRCWRGRG